MRHLRAVGLTAGLMTTIGVGSTLAERPGLGPWEWYVRLVATAPDSGGLRDRGNVLGQLRDSVADHDLHDLRELAPFASPYLSVVFPHPEWEEWAGDYGSDFHSRTRNQEDSWLFQVRTDDPWREVTVSWEGGAGLSRMALLDLGTEIMVEASTATSYTFTMDGSNVRDLVWLYNDKNDNGAQASSLRASHRRGWHQPLDWQPPGVEGDLGEPPRAGGSGR